ncbi:hypothetical protein DK459_04830 [Achromobacter sp. RW408]|nr:hypothetical protein DK459_04830 [Achromobacter sp. RW408]
MMSEPDHMMNVLLSPSKRTAVAPLLLKLPLLVTVVSLPARSAVPLLPTLPLFGYCTVPGKPPSTTLLLTTVPEPMEMPTPPSPENVRGAR